MQPFTLSPFVSGHPALAHGSDEPQPSELAKVGLRLVNYRRLFRILRLTAKIRGYVRSFSRLSLTHRVYWFVTSPPNNPNSHTTKVPQRQVLDQTRLANSYYGLLGLHPSASVQEIRHAYRDRSKMYHPDTTTLPRELATAKFQQLNEAYATLSSPERRLHYDRQIGYSSVPVVQPLPTDLRSRPAADAYSSAYLDPTDRPLSSGELFALFILGLTLVGCLVLAIALGVMRGESWAQKPPIAPLESTIIVSVFSESPSP
jgi:hypothetical protein